MEKATTADDDEPQADNAKSNRLLLVKASSITTEKAEWAWAYGGKGRILKAAITLFGGRPGREVHDGPLVPQDGQKARWGGVQEGQPVNVAYIATEEAWNYTVAPSLQAAGADMDRVYFVPHGDNPARIRSIVDEAALTELFIANDIRAVFLDPLMGTIKGDADINRNNEVRDYLDPWVRIAEKIDGPRNWHLPHDESTDRRRCRIHHPDRRRLGSWRAACSGSLSTANPTTVPRVLSQAKNSAGFEDLSLAYRIGSHRVTLDDGKTADMARFELIGPTDTTVRELLLAERSSATRSGTDDCGG